MKKFVVLALAVIIISVAVPGARAEYWNEGNYGYSEETAYVIDSISDFITLRDRVRNGTEIAGMYYRLETDLDLSAYRDEWLMITPFKGHFNGNGHTINLVSSTYTSHWDYFAKRGEYAASLFGDICTEDGYAVKNLTVSGNIFSRCWGAGIAMEIVKDSNASIENCKYTGEIDARAINASTIDSRGEAYADAGGIVCYLSGGTVKNCTVEDAEIKISIWKTGPWSVYTRGGGNLGGIAAKMTGGTIEGCTIQQNVRMIIGTVNSSSYDSTRVIVDVNTTYMGGIIGLLDSGTGKSKTVKDNVSYPVISSNWAIGAGAIAGKISDYSGVNIADNIYTGTSHGIGYGPGGSGDDRGCVNAGKITLTITTASLPSGNIGDSYSESLTATTTGGTWQATWALTSGTLPAGLTLNSDGTISGSPTAKGTYKFTVKASIGSSGIISATKEYTITIADNQPSYSLTVKNTSLSAGTVGKNYSETLKAELTGAELPASWSYTGTLPPGLTLNTSGTITGTPTKAGEYTFTVKAVFGAFEGTKSFTITIAQAHNPAAAPSITTSSLPSGKVSESYSAALSATGTAPITWSASGLPSGLTMNAGTITGTPTQSGTFTVKITASNSAGSVSKTFTVTIASGGSSIETPEYEAMPEFKTQSLLLSGQIGLNFYMDLPKISGVNYLDKDCYMEFDIDGDSKSNNPQPYDPEFMNAKKIYYGFRCYLNSIQMADLVTATFHYGDGKTVTKNYSAKQYIDTVLGMSGFSDEVKNLMAAMKDYGHYMQVFLSKSGRFTIGVDHAEMDCANVYTDSDIAEASEEVAKYKAEYDISGSGIKKLTYSLVLDSEIALNIYLTPSEAYKESIETPEAGDEVEGVYAYLDGGKENLAVLQTDGRYLVQISGISAHLLGNTYTVTVHAGGTFDVKISALSYAEAVLSSSVFGADAKKGVTSLYKYYETTMAYRESEGIY